VRHLRNPWTTGGHSAGLNNTVSANNDVCEQFATAGFLPILGGGGIVLAGAPHNTNSSHVVTDNRGDTLFSGDTSSWRRR
jgi:hypothetical protein